MTTNDNFPTEGDRKFWAAIHHDDGVHFKALSEHVGYYATLKEAIAATEGALGAKGDYYAPGWWGHVRMVDCVIAAETFISGEIARTALTYVPDEGANQWLTYLHETTRMVAWQDENGPIKNPCG